MKNFKFLIILVASGYTLMVSLAFAEGYTLSVPIPGFPSTGVTSLGQFIKAIYSWSLGIVGLVAFAMIVWGAIEYTVSAGNASRRQEAVDRITQAIIGLTLLLGAYVILYTIDPGLVTLKEPGITNLPEVQGPELTLPTFLPNRPDKYLAIADDLINKGLEFRNATLDTVAAISNINNEISDVYRASPNSTLLAIRNKADGAFEEARDAQTQANLAYENPASDDLVGAINDLRLSATHLQQLLQDKPDIEPTILNPDPPELKEWFNRVQITVNASTNHVVRVNNFKSQIENALQKAQAALAKAQQAKGEMELWLSQQAF